MLGKQLALEAGPGMFLWARALVTFTDSLGDLVRPKVMKSVILPIVKVEILPFWSYQLVFHTLKIIV